MKCGRGRMKVEAEEERGRVVTAMGPRTDSGATEEVVTNLFLGFMTCTAGFVAKAMADVVVGCCCKRIVVMGVPSSAVLV